MKVIDNVFKIEATKGGYAYIVKGEDTFMIDTGMPKKAKAILDEIVQLGINKKDIKNVFLTHNDVDHVGNAVELCEETGAKLWCSKTDIPYILGEKQRYGVKKIVAKLIKYKRPEHIYALDEKKLPKKLQIIETPGHTPGHVCFLYDGILFVGDLMMVMGGKLTKSRRIMTWDMEKVDASIKNILNYEFKYICPAHGEPMVVNKELLEIIRKL